MWTWSTYSHHAFQKHFVVIDYASCIGSGEYRVYQALTDLGQPALAEFAAHHCVVKVVIDTDCIMLQVVCNLTVGAGRLSVVFHLQ